MRVATQDPSRVHRQAHELYQRVRADVARRVPEDHPAFARLVLEEFREAKVLWRMEEAA